MSTAKQHVEALLQLPADERAAAAEILLESLEDDDEGDPTSTEAWAVEIQRRIEENAPGIPGDEVFAELRARYRTKK